jgi:hypothetical protein
VRATVVENIGGFLLQICISTNEALNGLQAVMWRLLAATATAVKPQGRVPLSKLRAIARNKQNKYVSIPCLRPSFWVQCDTTKQCLTCQDFKNKILCKEGVKYVFLGPRRQLCCQAEGKNILPLCYNLKIGYKLKGRKQFQGLWRQLC